MYRVSMSHRRHLISYIGETSRALDQRLAEHENVYIGRKETSWAWHHVERGHDDEHNRFTEIVIKLVITYENFQVHQHHMRMFTLAGKRRVGLGTMSKGTTMMNIIGSQR